MIGPDGIQTHCYLGPSSEFVSSSIPSWQILTAHAQPFREARDLAFCLKVPLDSLLVWASSEGSGETARMRSLAWTFAARIGNKYQIRLTRSIYNKMKSSHGKKKNLVIISGSIQIVYEVLFLLFWWLLKLMPCFVDDTQMVTYVHESLSCVIISNLLRFLQYFLFHVSPEINEPGHEKMCLMSYANNKGADQPAHPRSLISTFVVHWLDTIISLGSVAEI